VQNVNEFRGALLENTRFLKAEIINSFIIEEGK
jgi:hypothetical protein